MNQRKLVTKQNYWPKFCLCGTTSQVFDWKHIVQTLCYFHFLLYLESGRRKKNMYLSLLEQRMNIVQNHFKLNAEFIRNFKVILSNAFYYWLT